MNELAEFVLEAVRSALRGTLDRARKSLASGLDLDDTCRAIHPGYARWDTFLQKAFRSALRASLEAEPPDAGPG
jgi:hypothetical protein